MLHRIDRHLKDAGRSREDFEIVLMPAVDDLDNAQTFKDMGVDRLTPMVMLDSDNSVQKRLEHLYRLNDAMA